jgi:hypothetical protein
MRKGIIATNYVLCGTIYKKKLLESLCLILATSSCHVIYDKIKNLNPFSVELLHRKDFFEPTCLELDLEMFHSRTVPEDSVNLFIVYF